MFASRGCYARCTFCTEWSQWVKFRWRSAANVVAEMERDVEKWNPKYISIEDSLINGNLKVFEEMCDLLIKRQVPISWGGKARIHHRMDLDFLKKAKAAGCGGMTFGLESGSQAVVDHMRKRLNLDVAEQVIRDCHRAGLSIGCFFIAGYVTETEADFQSTLDFIERNHPYITWFHTGGGLVITRGSELERRGPELGIIMPEDSPDGHWRSVDGSNTIEVRRRRLETLNSKIQEVMTRDKKLYASI
jgi:radical SAM superfamily enzyme YgiQ (UPF0313 family)